jgi:hypothetical protein
METDMNRAHEALEGYLRALVSGQRPFFVATIVIATDEVAGWRASFGW